MAGDGRLLADRRPEARHTGAAVINAGDGCGQHPTQALLDLYALSEAVGGFADEPLRGWGAGSFPLVHRRYREDELAVRQPHSVPLQFLAGTGIVGLTLLLGLVAAAAAAGVGAVRRLAGAERDAAAALLAASRG